MRRYFIIFLLYISSCQSIKEYNNYLVDKSIASEIPTLMGNIVGGVCGVPFLLFTTPTGYLIYGNENDERNSFILSPVKWASYGGGIILGTPFLPLGFAFPRTRPIENFDE